MVVRQFHLQILRSYDWFRQTKKPSELQWDAGIGLTKMFNSAFGLNIDYT
jgi:hypothetical protein